MYIAVDEGEFVLKRDEVVNLLAEGQQTMAMFSERLLRSGNLWVARDDDDSLMGVAAVVPLGRNLYEVGPVVVLPHHQGKGVAQQLLRNIAEARGSRRYIWISHNGRFIGATRKTGMYGDPAPFLSVVQLYRLRITTLFWSDTWKAVWIHLSLVEKPRSGSVSPHKSECRIVT